MKLNPDCIRDILITIEENTGFNSYMSYPNHNINYKLLSSYSQNEVLYHLKQCELSELVTKIHWYIDGTCTITDLSPEGHKFLADIRSDTTWNRTKEISKKVGSSSISALKEIATSVIAELIKSQF
ncbi:hypothetical protein A0J52_09930 [Clostridium sporogenes]|uniref:DUF2513 domain-containing protein n=1 Tax=Clostridium sporogenes TaxID=1509 RepID=UPI00077FE6A9|nr:DUF2513 domain-containing protein [Clostridium sporogenes]KYN77170.1 hypothetical protein A0J52_09930 [Clostridium sporogenes]